MPTYEFSCPRGHEFEKFYRKISDAGAEVSCPRCGEVAQRRVSGGAGLLFKGSGFYATDYGKGGKKAQPAAQGGDSSGAARESAGESAGEGKGAGEAPAATTPGEGKSQGKGQGSGGGGDSSGAPTGTRKD